MLQYNIRRRSRSLIDWGSILFKESFGDDFVKEVDQLSMGDDDDHPKHRNG